MARGETGFSDVTYDLIALQHRALKEGHGYGQYVSDAEKAGLNDVAQFFRDTMREDSARAARAHELLKNITGTDQAGPAMR
jgi:rubrerythrin